MPSSLKLILKSNMRSGSKEKSRSSSMPKKLKGKKNKENNREFKMLKINLNQEGLDLMMLNK